MSQTTTARQEIEAALIAKALAEPAFRQALLSDAKAAIEKEFGVALPAGIDLKVMEETVRTNYLVLPAVVDGELTDSDLEAVTGGWFRSFAVAAKTTKASINDLTFGVQKSKTHSADKNAEAVRSLL
jgi:hypothetical protein